MRLGLRTATLAAGAVLALGLPQAQAQHHYDTHHDYVQHGGHVDVTHHSVHHDGGHYVQPYYPQTYYYPQQQVQYVQPAQPAQYVQQPVQPVQYIQQQPAPAAQPSANQVPRVRTASNTIPYQGRGVTILNPQDGSVNYTLDDAHNYTMGPGQSQKLASKGSWVITFNRGGDFGDARYTLSEGTYEFAVGDQGWGIRRKAEAVAADAPPPPPAAPAANALPATRTAGRSG